MGKAESQDEKFSRILEDTQAHVRAYIAGMGVASSDTDDIAQDVYLELYRNLDGIPADVEPIRWLKGVARNICLNDFHENLLARFIDDREALNEQEFSALLAALLGDAEMSRLLKDILIVDDLCAQAHRIDRKNFRAQVAARLRDLNGGGLKADVV